MTICARRGAENRINTYVTGDTVRDLEEPFRGLMVLEPGKKFIDNLLKE